MTGFYKRHNRPVDRHRHRRRRRRLRGRYAGVRDNGATPDAERAQMTSVCHTHGENYHFKFVNVHVADIRRERDAVLFSRSSGKMLRRKGTRDKMMAPAIIMIIPPLLREALRLLRFRVFSLWPSSPQDVRIIIHVILSPSFSLFLSFPVT